MNTAITNKRCGGGADKCEICVTQKWTVQPWKCVPEPPSPFPRVTNKFHGFQYKKSRERSIFVIDKLKGMQSPKQGEWKGCYLSIEGTRKGYLFSLKKKKTKKNKLVTWKGKRLDLQTEPPRVNICWVPPLPLGPDLTSNADKVCAAPNLVVPRIFKSYLVFLCLGVQHRTH